MYASHPHGMLTQTYAKFVISYRSLGDCLVVQIMILTSRKDVF